MFDSFFCRANFSFDSHSTSGARNEKIMKRVNNEELSFGIIASKVFWFGWDLLLRCSRTGLGGSTKIKTGHNGTQNSKFHTTQQQKIKIQLFSSSQATKCISNSLFDHQIVKVDRFLDFTSFFSPSFEFNAKRHKIKQQHYLGLIKKIGDTHTHTTILFQIA